MTTTNALELKVPPLVLALVCVGAMGFASARLPDLTWDFPGRLALAMAIAGIGLFFALAGVLVFRRARTTVNPIDPGAASALVISGIYRVSRNPMYVGALFALAGWAVFLSHALAFAFLPGFVAYLNRFQIAPEERVLLAKFGQDFATYMRSVRRWL